MILIFMIDINDIVFFIKFLNFYRHLSLIIKQFSEHGYGCTERTEYFGTYRVDLIIVLFSNIIDIDNFEIILQCLSPKEAGCMYCRLGWYVR